MRFLITNIGQLLTFQGSDRPRQGPEMRKVGLFRDGVVLVDDGKIAAAGIKDIVMRHPGAETARIIDVEGRLVMPGFIDSHTHPVYAAPRLDDFAMRLEGKTYQEIAAKGGGILSSVDRVRGATQETLVEGLLHWTGKMIECGTTTLEAKSGYGLDLETELKMLRAIRRAAEITALEIIPTFLGAHALPAELRDRPGDYVKRVCDEMIPAVSRDRLALFVDVFCEKGYFSEPDAALILGAGAKAGLRAKIHAEQLSRSGGAKLAARIQAVSADHLDRSEPEDWEALKKAGVVAAFLPAANYFLGGTYPPARRMIDAGVPVAVATDFNPGTSPCWNMQMALSIACTQMKMAPEEALTAATINGAWALGLGATHGSIEAGKQADIIVMDVQDYREIPYYFGSNLVTLVMKKGAVVHTTANLRPFE